MKKYTHNFYLILVPIFIFLNIGTITAQQKTISFETDEGTWMALDISPNGKTIHFELLGDIYTLPSQGGAAKPKVEAYQTKDNLVAFTGEYHSIEVDVPYAIQVENNQLVVYRNKEKIDTLSPISKDVFSNGQKGYQFTRKGKLVVF